MLLFGRLLFFLYFYLMRNWWYLLYFLWWMWLYLYYWDLFLSTSFLSRSFCLHLCFYMLLLIIYFYFLCLYIYCFNWNWLIIFYVFLIHFIICHVLNILHSDLLSSWWIIYNLATIKTFTNPLFFNFILIYLININSLIHFNLFFNLFSFLLYKRLRPDNCRSFTVWFM